MADDVDIFEEQVVEEPGVLGKIDEFLKKDIRVKPEFWGLRELTDWEKHRTARDARQTLDSFATDIVADVFEGVANPFNLQENIPTFEELKDADPFTKTAVAGPRLALNVLDFFLGKNAEDWRRRSDKLSEGMTTDEIIEEEIQEKIKTGELKKGQPLRNALKTAAHELNPVILATGLGLVPLLKWVTQVGPAKGMLYLQGATNLDKPTLKKAWGSIKNLFEDPVKGIMKSGSTATGPTVIEPTGEVEDIIQEFAETNKAKGGMAYGGDPGELSSGVAGDDPYFKLKDLDLDESPFELPQDLDLFEEAMKQGPEEIQVANLVGKAPIWAVAGVEKAKILAQNLSKSEKSILRTIGEKLGIKTKPVKEAVEDIDIIDPEVVATTTAVKKKPLKPISDSPETAESMFYSNVEAKMMDPNTPESFATADDLFKFLHTRGVSKPELEDNILSRYVAMAKKNGTPLIKNEMLEIIRQSPMRKVETVNYGWLGEKTAKYADGNMSTGFIPGTYRESVLYLDPKHIPLDPGKLSTFEGPTHGFSERYVIGWSRLSDRMAKLPVEKGIPMAIDPKKMKSLDTNLKKIERQIIGLESSAARKLKREGAAIFDDVDNMDPVDIRNNLKHFEDKLKEIDEPLYNQILQFRNKIDADRIQLNKMKAATKGEEIRVTFADEIQSDVLQNAKRMEEKFKKALGDLIDKNKIFREQEIARETRGYGGRFDKMNPEVIEYFLKHKSVFRPIFQTAQEMQMFMDEFAKTQKIFTELAAAGKWPSKELMKRAEAARVTETKMLGELEKSLTKESMKILQPNIPFKDRGEWGEALIKRDLHQAAERLFVDKADDAATMYVISPAKPISETYWKGQNYGGTHTPLSQRTKDMKGIGMEEFYGGPNSMAPKTWQIVQGEGKNKKIIKGKFKTKDEARAEWSQMEDRGSFKIEEDQKHYTSVLEKALIRAAKENNSEVVTVKVKMGDKWVEAFGIKLTPEMLLPHKTHRKDGGMVYTPELIDIFEAA